jgi:hypothetical protein
MQQQTEEHRVIGIENEAWVFVLPGLMFILPHLLTNVNLKLRRIR